MRRSIYDIINDSGVDLNVEYRRLYSFFYLWEHCIDDWNDLNLTLYQCVDKYFDIIHKSLKKRCICLEDFNDTFGYHFVLNPESIDLEELVRFVEYTINFSVGLLCCRNCEVVKVSEKYINLCKECMEVLSFQYVLKDDIVIFVEANPDSVAVAEITGEELSCSVMEYNHHRLKGDIASKKSILKMMYDDIEPNQRELEAVNRTLKSDLFQLMNKFIRHNNSDNKFIQTLNNNQLEAIYDEIYQLWLLAKLELDNVERNKRVKELLNAVNSK